MAPDDNDSPKNPFVRWKQHVDAHIGLTLNGLLGIPTIVSKNLNIRRLSEDGTISKNSDRSSSSANPAAPGTDGPSPAANHQRDTGIGGGGDGSDSGVLDGVDAAQLLEWHKFIYYSPYSPLRLQLQPLLHGRPLPPPLPQDVPFGVDPYAFTYTDAFEDLLRASSGRPLLDLSARSCRNTRYPMRFGAVAGGLCHHASEPTEPPYVFFHRMHSDRLLDAYFPRAVAATASSNPWKDEKLQQAVLRRNENNRFDDPTDENNDNVHETDDDVDDDDDDNVFGWNRRDPFSSSRRWDDMTQFPTRRLGGEGGGLFNELDRVFRVLGRILDEETGTMPKREKDGNDSSTPAEADTEDELYTAVRSAYANAEKSLSTFVQSLTGLDRGGLSKDTSDASDDPSSPPVLRQKDSDGGETIRTTENLTDMFGNRHVKTVVRRLDADGRETARQTHYSVRSSELWEQAPGQDRERERQGEETKPKEKEVAAATENGKEAEETSASTDGAASKAGKKPSGWFWR